MTSSPTLKLEHVRGQYGLEAPLNLTLNGPQVISVVGPNGAGKSTLLKLILGVDQSAEGRVLIDAQPLCELSSTHRALNLSYLPQTPPYMPHWTLEELISQGRAPHRRARVHELRLSLTSSSPPMLSSDQECVERHILDLRLETCRHQTLGTMSGGERRRAFLARTLCQETQTMLLDEPLAHLDWSLQEFVLQHLYTLTWQRNAITLIVLHDVNLASLYSDQVILFHQDRSIPPLIGPPREILNEDTLSLAFDHAPLLTPHPRHPHRVQRLPFGPV